MKLPTPQAVIFDWDNTLVDTWPVIHEALVSTFQEMGKTPWTLEQTKARVSKSMRDSFPEIFGEGWQKAAQFYQSFYRAHHLQKLEPLPRALEVLKRVREKKIFSAVVSNKKGPTLRQEITHLGWDHYFDAIIGADDAARDKPFSDPVHLAFEKSHLAPGPYVWFIGDSEVDLECALTSGCTAILYGESAKDHPEYSDTHYRGFAYQGHVHSHVDTLKLFA